MRCKTTTQQPPCHSHCPRTMRLQHSRVPCRRCWAALLVIAVCSLAWLPQAGSQPTVHTVVPTECGLYFTWQTLGIFYSHRKSGQTGPITRLMSCTEQQLASYNDVDLVPTHVAPSLTQDPAHNDVYSAYNKPGAVMHWIQNTDPPEDFILVIDADMIMRLPFYPDQLGAGPGWAISAYFSYMKGVSNELAEKHVPWVRPRNDTIAGPLGRKGDMVGGFCLMDKNDLRRVAPLWLKYSMDVRNDPDAWNLTGDHYSIHPGDKPWISEMYGYSYGTAHANVWHKVDYSAMIYPGDYTPSSPPKVIHYGLLYSVANTGYSYDKHWHYGFDARRCPPWGDLDQQRAKGGLFPHPPHPKSLTTQGFELMRDLMAIETIVTLNAAFCEHHYAHCPDSEELTRECGKVADMEATLDRMFGELAPVLAGECGDRDTRCRMWADQGECLANPGYMLKSCEKACGHCFPTAPSSPSPAAQGDRLRGAKPILLGRATPLAAQQVKPGSLLAQRNSMQAKAVEVAHRNNPDAHDHSELHADQGIVHPADASQTDDALTSEATADSDADTPPAPPGKEDAAVTAGSDSPDPRGTRKPMHSLVIAQALKQRNAQLAERHNAHDDVPDRFPSVDRDDGRTLRDPKSGGEDAARFKRSLPQAGKEGKTLHSALVNVAGIENPRSPPDAAAQIVSKGGLQQEQALLDAEPVTLKAVPGSPVDQPRKLSDATKKLTVRGIDIVDTDAIKMARNLDDVKPILPEQQPVMHLEGKTASTIGEALTADSYADSMPEQVGAVGTRGFDQPGLPKDDLVQWTKPRPPKSGGPATGRLAGLLSHLGWIGLGLWGFSIVAFLMVLPRARRRATARKAKARRML